RRPEKRRVLKDVELEVPDRGLVEERQVPGPQGPDVEGPRDRQTRQRPEGPAERPPSREGPRRGPARPPGKPPEDDGQGIAEEELVQPAQLTPAPRSPGTASVAAPVGPAEASTGRPARGTERSPTPFDRVARAPLYSGPTFRVAFDVRPPRRLGDDESARSHSPRCARAPALWRRRPGAPLPARRGRRRALASVPGPPGAPVRGRVPESPGPRRLAGGRVDRAHLGPRLPLSRPPRPARARTRALGGRLLRRLDRGRDRGDG